ncbi:flavin-binding monooxygenase-like family protein [Neofusicoccum parvum]|nr:flavin-binding monooxygenase-like family protein [Neofusicoccum parvum]
MLPSCVPWTSSVRRGRGPRVEEAVEGGQTAEKLEAWCDVWCKRPTFHDGFLQAFDLPNVTLVDTDGRGLDGVSEKGVLATGCRSGLSLTPGSCAGAEVIGRDGVNLDDKWDSNGPLTLYGVSTNGFPNCFFFAPFQTRLAPNIVYVLDVLASHVAYILTTARELAGSDKFAVQPSKEAEEEWADEVVKRALWFSGMVGCTSSYVNGEGEAAKEKTPEEMLKAPSKATWGEGIASYVKRLEIWREDGTMKGLEIIF